MGFSTAQRMKRPAARHAIKMMALATSSRERRFPSSNALISTIAPVSLIGGTAAIYSSLLHHPSSTLTPLSLLFMMLLAVQYAIQPKLSRKFISKSQNKQKVALVEEILKTGMATAIFLGKPVAARSTALQDWSLSSSLAVAGLPATLYALQGVLQYTAHQHLDPVTFNGLSQTKTLSAAAACFFVLGKSQSKVQLLALAILFCSALVFQGQHYIFRQSSISSKDTSKNDTGKIQVMRGVLPCLGAALLSGLAGALSQKGLQLTGISGRDPFLYTVEISVYSALALLANRIYSALRSNGGNVIKPTNDTPWTWQTWIPIVCKAAGGVATALVHKYAGSVAKGFALMFGLVLSGVLERDSVKGPQIAGTALIMLSTWLHFTHPAVL